MENFSDIPPKKKAGRPRKWTYFDAPSLALLRPDKWTAISRRTQINEELSLRVYDALEMCTRMDKGDQKYDWLFRWKDGCKVQGMQTVIYALGRIEDYEGIKVLAGHICENKLKSKEALQFIKKVLLRCEEMNRGQVST